MRLLAEQPINGSMDVMTAAAVGGVIGLLIAALLGLVVGAVAKLLMPGARIRAAGS
jgi:hypothetical protein